MDQFLLGLSTTNYRSLQKCRQKCFDCIDESAQKGTSFWACRRTQKGDWNGTEGASRGEALAIPPATTTPRGRRPREPADLSRMRERLAQILRRIDVSIQNHSKLEGRGRHERRRRRSNKRLWKGGEGEDDARYGRLHPRSRHLRRRHLSTTAFPLYRCTFVIVSRHPRQKSPRVQLPSEYVTSSPVRRHRWMLPPFPARRWERW